MSQQRTRRERERSDSVVSGDGTLDQQRVHEMADPLLDRWRSGAELAAVRRRLQSVFGAGLLIIAIRFLLSPGGFTGTLIALWFLLSIPIVTVAGCLLVLLREPSNARSVWWDNSVPATVGLLSLVGLVRFGATSPGGRALWEVLIGDEHPDAQSYEFGEKETVDLGAVKKIRRYIWYAVVGSAAIVVIEQVVLNDLFGQTRGVDLTGAELAVLAVGAGFLGVVAGFAAAVIGR
ncbi:hypothetical protein [Halovenus sp. HT40]|uniref:hypothetical protein n=1 Tax=Halovenus sp. HT40 TaxID=3126691 RepID=UPI00300EBD4B